MSSRMVSTSISSTARKPVDDFPSGSVWSSLICFLGTTYRRSPFDPSLEFDISATFLNALWNTSKSRSRTCFIAVANVFSETLRSLPSGGFVMLLIISNSIDICKDFRSFATCRIMTETLSCSKFQNESNNTRITFFPLCLDAPSIRLATAGWREMFANRSRIALVTELFVNSCDFSFFSAITRSRQSMHVSATRSKFSFERKPNFAKDPSSLTFCMHADVLMQFVMVTNDTGISVIEALIALRTVAENRSI
mmetsp:Transcript_864/g.1840  ORF Transcript_864/g.1840 Transcript_864/m.1840 type:complete len:252 (+) Transcript_864:5451-6206(+)